MKYSPSRIAAKDPTIHAFIHFRTTQEPDRNDFARPTDESTLHRRVSMVAADIKRALAKRSAIAAEIPEDWLRSAAVEAIRVIQSVRRLRKTEHIAVIVDVEGGCHVGTARLGRKDSYVRRTGFELASRRAFAAYARHRAKVGGRAPRLAEIPESREELRKAVLSLVLIDGRN